MAVNKGYLTSNTTNTGDEMYTPKYAVQPLLKYLDKNKVIWCPFDTEDSQFVKVFNDNGYKVIYSHIWEDKDFFKYQPDNYDIIISNPPFSLKDQVIARLYELGKPFMILLPLNSLQGQKRYEYFSKSGGGIQLLSFDKRINYTNQSGKTLTASPFASAYFCRNILPKDLILEKLKNKEDII